jgi:hypothetical protein
VEEENVRFEGLEEKVANREKQIQELRRERNALLADARQRMSLTIRQGLCAVPFYAGVL